MHSVHRQAGGCIEAARVHSVLSKLSQAGKQARCPRMVLHVTLVDGERLFALTPQSLQVQGIPSCNAQACTARRTRQLQQQQHSCNSPAAALASSNPCLAAFRLWGVYFCIFVFAGNGDPERRRRKNYPNLSKTGLQPPSTKACRDEISRSGEPLTPIIHSEGLK